MTSFHNFFQRITQIIQPSPPIGGLEITDAFLRYVSLTGERASVVALRLPPGALDNGAVVNRDAVLSVFRSLYRQLLQSGSPLHIVATIASSRVYTQVVRLPAVANEQYDSALDLNLRANSPLDIASTYYDAELLGFGASNEREFLAAFVDRALIDPLHDLLVEVGFTIVAMEFPALSAARMLTMLGRGIDAQQPILLLSVVADGVDLMIVRRSHLFFHYWQSFRSLRENESSRAVDATAFQSAVSHALARTLNFYASQWNGVIRDVILLNRGIAPSLQPVLDRSSLRVVPFVATRFDDAAQVAPSALGAALRGLISRHDDTFISIAPLGTEAGFLRAQFWYFVSAWRWICVVTTVCVFLPFLVTDILLAQQQSQYVAVAPLPDEAVTLGQVQTLRDEALVFNRSVDFVAEAFEERGAFSSLLADFRRLAGSGIAIKRIAFQLHDRSIAFTGHAASGLAAIDFKTTLARQPRFTNVTLPFSRITPEDSGVSFQLTLNLQK